MTFSLQAENDWILLETGTDNLLKEDGLTNLALETAPAFLDLTAYLRQASATLKFNTLDFTLIDPPLGVAHLGEDFKVTDPGWTGNVVGIETSEPTELGGHLIVRITASNAKALPADTAPFDLSETPANGTFDYLLEDGTSHFLLEDGTDFAPGIFLIEGTLSYDYSGLSVLKQINTTGPPTTLGRARVFQPGLRPGNAFKLTNTDQGYAGSPFQINQIGVTWPAKAGIPFYDIEFGDTPQTLAQWTQITAPAATVPVSAPVVVPTGPQIYGNASAGHTLFAAGGGIVTVASAVFSVNAPIGHTLTVQVVGQIDCRAYGWDNYIAVPRRAVRALLSGGIYTGSWLETPAGTPTTSGARAIYDVSSAPGIALAAGTYTVSVQIDSQEFNQMEVFSAYVQAAVRVV